MDYSEDGVCVFAASVGVVVVVGVVVGDDVGF